MRASLVVRELAPITIASALLVAAAAAYAHAQSPAVILALLAGAGALAAMSALWRRFLEPGRT